MAAKKPAKKREARANPQKKESKPAGPKKKEKPRPAAGKKPENRKPEKPRPEERKSAPEKPMKPEQVKEKPAKPAYRVKPLLFGRWDMSEVRVSDPGLAGHINLDPVIVPRTSGKFAGMPFHKSRMNIAERFMNRLMVPGHRGKKHKLTSGICVGNSVGLYNDMKLALEILGKKTGKNPMQVLVLALENSSLLEEVASYRMGGIIARQAVLVSPQRRLDLALRHLTQGIYRKSFRNRKPLSEVIAEEILAAYNRESSSFAISERNRIEKEAEGAR
jgi:small subunit ribosomal protein S7